MVIHLAAGPATSPSTIARPRRPRPRTTSFSTTRAKADPAKSRDSALAIGVPGTVAGLALAARRYGSGQFTLAELIAPAIELARDGIPVDGRSRGYPAERDGAAQRAGRRPAKIFLKPDGTPLARGDLLVQRDLADTLEAIAKDGPRAFYDGPIADKIAAAVQAAGGIMTADDLEDYRRGRARAGARQLSRLRHRLDAAVVVRRRRC